MLLRKLGYTGSNNNQTISSGGGLLYVLDFAWRFALLAAWILDPKCRASVEESDDGIAQLDYNNQLQALQVVRRVLFSEEGLT